MTVFIQHFGLIIAVDVSPDAIVSDLISAANQTDLPPSTPLSFGGKLLHDGRVPLSDLGIGAESLITALPPLFEGARIGCFDVEGEIATLHDDMYFSQLCVAHKTSIGQKSKMRVRILNKDRECSAVFWAQDVMCTDQAVLKEFFEFGVGVSGNEIGGDIIITVNAKELSNVKVNYKDSHHKGRHWVGRNLYLNEDFNDIHNVTDRSQIQICVKLKSWSKYPARIELIDFEFVR